MEKEVETKTKVFEKVRSIVANQLFLDPTKIERNANFTTDLGADSLDIVELILSLEEEFDIEIPDEVASQISNLDEAAKVIAQKIRVS
jgi:acyl carrier protein